MRAIIRLIKGVGILILETLEYIRNQQNIRMEILSKLYFSYYMYPFSDKYEVVWIKPKDTFESVALEYLQQWDMINASYIDEREQFLCSIKDKGFEYFEQNSEKSYTKNKKTLIILELLYRNLLETDDKGIFSFKILEGDELEKILWYLKRNYYISIVIHNEMECLVKITKQGIQLFENSFK
jgi:hypothetical protein